MITVEYSKKKKNFYKLFYDDEYIGCVPKSLVPEEFFLNNDNSNDSPKTNEDEDYINTLKEWVYTNALNKLLEYLAKMEKTVLDCRIFLKRHEIPESVIIRVIKEAEEKNWLSDVRYADLYTEEAVLCGRSPLEIKHKLLLKKIDKTIVENALKEHYTSETKDEVLLNLITSLIKKNHGLDKEILFEKIATALYRKGFKYNEYEDLLKKKIWI
ncbi:MAG: RecX family transcriptional regulator [Candidatus Cloacimonetes bacterium]|nr:RecX family transcriptional regulator [Candidatus Cloacimonadota bacterium]